MESDALPRIDARGMRCPWPALRAAKAMREMSAFTILADDPLAERELAALASGQGWSFRPLIAPESSYFLEKEKEAPSSL